MSNIMIAIPMKPGINAKLKTYCIEALSKMAGTNPLHSLHPIIDDSPIDLPPEKLLTPWSRVAVARNIMLSKANLKDFDYVLWIDADVVSYPPDMPTRLIEANPD